MVAEAMRTRSLTWEGVRMVLPGSCPAAAWSCADPPSFETSPLTPAAFPGSPLYPWTTAIRRPNVSEAIILTRIMTGCRAERGSRRTAEPRPYDRAPAIAALAADPYPPGGFHRGRYHRLRVGP